MACNKRVGMFSFAAMILALAITMMSAAPARAQSESEIARLQEAVTSELWVYSDAQPIHGFLTRFTNHEITLLDDSQQELTIPLDSVWRIDRRGDPLWNGMAIGAAVGVTEFFVLLRWETPRHASFGQMSAAFAYAVGIPMLIGAGIDALHVGRTTVYQEPRRQRHHIAFAPTLDGRGAMVSWRMRF